MELLESSAAEVRRAVRRRLRREAGAYVPTLTVIVMTFWGATGWLRLGALALLVATIGGIVVTLLRSERAMARAPLDRSLRDVLSDLLARIDVAARRYHLAYVAVFVAIVPVCIALVYARQGTGPWLAVSLLAGAGAIAWSYYSGRAYVRHKLQRWRQHLAQCLRELEAGPDW